MNSYLPYANLQFCTKNQTDEVTHEFLTHGGKNIPDDGDVGYVLEVNRAGKMVGVIGIAKITLTKLYSIIYVLLRYRSNIPILENRGIQSFLHCAREEK